MSVQRRIKRTAKPPAAYLDARRALQLLLQADNRGRSSTADKLDDFRDAYMRSANAVSPVSAADRYDALNAAVWNNRVHAVDYAVADLQRTQACEIV